MYNDPKIERKVERQAKEIKSLRKQLEMKRDDWLEVCKENDELQEQVKELNKLIDIIEYSANNDTCTKALIKLQIHEYRRLQEYRKHKSLLGDD